MAAPCYGGQESLRFNKQCHISVKTTLICLDTEENKFDIPNKRQTLSIFWSVHVFDDIRLSDQTLCYARFIIDFDGFVNKHQIILSRGGSRIWWRRLTGVPK